MVYIYMWGLYMGISLCTFHLYYILWGKQVRWAGKKLLAKKSYKRNPEDSVLTQPIGPWDKSLNFILSTKYVIPKSLKFSHWLSKHVWHQSFHMMEIMKYSKDRMNKNIQNVPENNAPLQNGEFMGNCFLCYLNRDFLATCKHLCSNGTSK